MPRSSVEFDEIGPKGIIQVYDPATGMKGVVVIDTTVSGRAAGGTRMLPDVTTEEVFWLARAMTYKLSTIGIPTGGAKAGIMADPGLSGAAGESILKAFGRAVKPLLNTGLALGGDMGTSAHDLATIYEGAGLSYHNVSLAKQVEDSLPLGDHVTGYGVVASARAACEFADINIKGATVAIEGFGKAGGGVARYIAEAGARVVAISTISGTAYNENGLDVNQLLAARIKDGDKAVDEYPDARHFDASAIYQLPVDILIPGARPYAINKHNASQVQAKIITCIANAPITEEADKVLFQRGICSVPDFISNAGGSVLAAADYISGVTVDTVFRVASKLISSLTTRTLTDAKKEGVAPRELAVRRAKEKVLSWRQEDSAPYRSREEWQRFLKWFKD